MNILLLCTKDLCGCFNLNTLLPRLSPQYRVLVLLSAYELPEERGNPLADALIYHEKDYPLHCLFPAIDTVSDRSLTKGARLHTFTGLARRWRVPMHSLPLDHAVDALYHHAVNFSPDLILCCRFTHVLPEKVFALPTLGAFNIHSGLLPQCAGPDATFWAMHQGWTHSGCTLHRITEHVDGGDIVGCARFSLHRRACLLSNRIRAYGMGLRMFFQTLALLEQGRPTPCWKQNLALRHYYPFPSIADFEAFTLQGNKLVDPHAYQRLLYRFLPLDKPLSPKVLHLQHTINYLTGDRL